MADTGGAAADAVVGTRLGMAANRAHAKKANSWRRVLLLVASWLWFFVSASLAFSTRFVMTRRLFRAKKEEDKYSPHEDSNSSPAQPPEEGEVTEPAKFEEEDVGTCKGEAEAPVFQFRFSFQAPLENIGAQGNALGGDAVSSTTTSVSNSYRFQFERDLSGFLEAPQVTTMSVHESYVGSDGVVLKKKTRELDGELRGRLSALKSSEGTADSVAGGATCGDEEVDDNGVPSDDVELGNAEKLDVEFGDSLSSLSGSETAQCRGLDSDVVVHQNTEELDRELKTRLSAVKFASETYLAPKGPVHGDPHVPVCSSSCSDGDALVDGEELDRDLTARFLSVKSCAGSGVDEAAASICARGLSAGSPHNAEESEEEEEEEEDQLDGACPLPQWRTTGGLDSDTPSDSLSDGYSVKDLNLDLDSEGFLSEGDFEPDTDKASLSELNGESGEFFKCIDAGSAMDPRGQNVELAEEYSITDGEEEFHLRQKPGTSGDEKGEQFNGRAETVHSNSWRTPAGSVNPNSDEAAQRREDGDRNSGDQTTTHWREVIVKELTPEESEELESLWEHQDLIEQLRTELRKVRSINNGLLPTILEESESPPKQPTEGGLTKPCKFDARFLHEDPMDELHKLYKSYRERMRKLDILNYQKMYALGFLQLDNPLQSMVTQKPFVPALITSLLSHNIWPRRRKSGSSDPSETFLKELQSDLETVYVGQACLSWEFLRWQHERTREFLDPADLHQDGRPAGEFQRFQVLVQRFLEDEPFQGPRVLNYVKNRCVIRSLLQVPVVTEDCLKGKTEEKSKWEDGVTCEELESAMDRSIRVFWEFVKADKDDTPTVVKGLIGTPHVEPQDPADRKLMLDIQADLQKKEKKLRDITRAGNCLVKKFKINKPRSVQDDLLFTQV